MYMPNLAYILRINSFVLLALISIPCLVSCFAKKSKIFEEMLKSKVSIVFVFINFIITLYYLAITFYAGTSVTNIFELRIIQNLIPIYYWICSIAIISELKYLRLSNNEILEFIIKVAVLQGIICLLMSFMPFFRNIALNIFYSNHKENIYLTRSRLYGICDGDYTYGFQILNSLMALFSITYGICENKKKYYFLAIIILIATFLNGRSGLIIFAISMVVISLYFIFVKKNLFKSLRLIISLVIIIFLSLLIIKNYLPNTYILLEHGVNDVLSFLNGDNTTESSTLFSDMLFFPENPIKFIFGSGFRVFGKKGYQYGVFRSSDIGYVNDIFMGGIILLFLEFFEYIYAIFIIYKNNSKKHFEQIACLCILITMLMANFKGELFRSQMLCSTIILLIVAMLFKKNEGAENENRINNYSR